LPSCTEQLAVTSGTPAWSRNVENGAVISTPAAVEMLWRKSAVVPVP
jgi:hypothetical protein